MLGMAKKGRLISMQPIQFCEPLKIAGRSFALEMLVGVDGLTLMEKLGTCS
jgi:hypothetical protein